MSENIAIMRIVSHEVVPKAALKFGQRQSSSGGGAVLLKAAERRAD